MSVYDCVLFFLACGFVTDSYVHVDNCGNSNKRPIVTCCEATDKQRVQDASFAQINSKKQRFTSEGLSRMNKKYKKQKYMRAKRTRHRKKSLIPKKPFNSDASEIRTSQWTEEKKHRRNVRDALLQEQVTCEYRPENVDDSNMSPRKF